MINNIEINENSRIPKYQQIVDSIIDNISKGNYEKDQKIPSINMLSEEYYLSRDTVEKAYKILKKRNIITSIRGKGYYISKEKLNPKKRILFLTNKLSAYKSNIYHSLMNNITISIDVDIQVYHCDETLFLNILKDNKPSNYDYIIVFPHFKTPELSHISFTEKVLEEIRKIPDEKLIILDDIKLGENRKIVEIYQDFENDIFNALTDGIDKINSYENLILVYPFISIYPYPKRILHGFEKFCKINKLKYEIISEVYEDTVIKKGDLFVTITETDLVKLIKQINEDEYVIGSDIGVISYNDTPLKDLLGISVLSTDFTIMGKKIAEFILNNEKSRFKVPYLFIDRHSI